MCNYYKLVSIQSEHDNYWSLLLLLLLLFIVVVVVVIIVVTCVIVTSVWGQMFINLVLSENNYWCNDHYTP